MPTKQIYLPPFAVILELLGLGKTPASAPDDDEMMLVPFRMLRLLLGRAVASEPFDEERYLHLNPDVALGVFRGEVGSGHQHFLTDGYFEGRDGAGEEFAEAWYLALNKDVATGIGTGDFPSGHAHYKAAGMLELRSPNARAEEDMPLWRACRRAKTCEPAASRNDPIELDSLRRKTTK